MVVLQSPSSRLYPASSRLDDHAYGRCSYIPVSPPSRDPQLHYMMAQPQQPLSPSATFMAGCLPKSPRSGRSSVEQLTKALAAHEDASSRFDATLFKGHTRQLAGLELRMANIERRASAKLEQARREAEHMYMEESSGLPAPEPHIQPVVVQETSSPHRKMHYIPAAAQPPRPSYSGQPSSPRRHSYKYEYASASLPTPPSSSPSSPMEKHSVPPPRYSYIFEGSDAFLHAPPSYSSPPPSPQRQHPSSPPKYHCGYGYAPATPPSSPPKQHPPPSPKRSHMHEPVPEPTLPHPPAGGVVAADAALKKFRRFALAARETKGDNIKIDELIASYPELADSLVDEVVIDCDPARV